MFRRPAVPTALCAALLLAACGPDGADTSLSPSVGTAASATTVGSEDAAQQLARGLALAMRAPDVRVAVRNAMRASRVTEHKLVLQEFASTSAGRRMVAAAAAGAGVSPAVVDGWIAQLPPLDFYAPFRQDRLTWRGTDNVIVAATLDLQSTEAAGYTTSGGRATVGIGGAVPGVAVLMLHPAEPKWPRVDPQPEGAGAVIQDADDGTLSGRLTVVNEHGRVVGTDLAELLRARRTPVIQMDTVEGGGGIGGGGGGSIGAPADITFLDYIKIEFTDWGGSEVMLKGNYYLANGTWESSSQLNLHMEKDVVQYPHVPFIYRRLRENSTERLNVKVEEDDTFNNDTYGDRNWYYGDRAQTRTVYEGNTPTAHIELDWTQKY
jgi:hypothetical protein